MLKNKIIKVKGVPYKIKFVDDLDDKEGFCETKDKIIVIKKSEDKKEFIDTVVHELYHAYFSECGLESYSCDEILIYWLAKHFFDIDLEVCKIYDELDD